jgi:hypothetical protein
MKAQGAAAHLGQRRSLAGGASWPPVVWAVQGRGLGKSFLLLFRFLLNLTEWVLIHLSNIYHINAYRRALHVSFGVNSRSIRNQCTLLAILEKIVVLYDSNVKT